MLLALSAWAWASASTAQSTQYTPPGTLGRPIVDRREALERAVEGARWRLGAVRIEPWIGLREVARVEQETAGGGTESDLTATAGAGLRFYLPVGSRATLAAETLPEYVWWREREDERRLAGRYAAGLFVHANRLALEATGRSIDGDTAVGPELEVRVPTEQQTGRLQIEVPLLGTLSLFGRAEASSLEIDAGEIAPGAEALERDEGEWQAGVRWRRGDFEIGAGAGRFAAEFDSAGAARDAEGESLLAELALAREKLGFQVAATAFELEAADGSAFEGFDDTLGQARLWWSPRDRFRWAVYGQERLTWSIESDRSYFVDRRLGSELALRIGRRTDARVFFETGENRYSRRPGQPGRVDDAESAGGGLDVEIRPGWKLAAFWRRTAVENAGLGVDRTIDELRVGFAFGSGPDGLF
jgi:hypothetical protein